MQPADPIRPAARANPGLVRFGSARPLVGVMVRLLAGLAVVVLGTWGVLARYYASATPTPVAWVVMALVAAATLLALAGLAVRRWRRWALAAYAVVFGGLLAWWSTIKPSNERTWKAEVAVLPTVRREGDLITIGNIRNFEYRTATDFAPRYYDRTFDVRKLRTVDLVASYWTGPAVAHIFISFGFGDDDYLSFSIERRDERGEDYSTLRGLFRQYELCYVVADERDVIRLRTNFRADPPEDVYLYRLHGPLEDGRRLFLEYVRRLEQLAVRPEFYNTLTSNCAGNIWLNAHVNPDRIAWSWKILLSGHLPAYLHECGLLNQGLAFAELQQRSRINDAARAAGDTRDFSRLIRAGLPFPVIP